MALLPLSAREPKVGVGEVDVDNAEHREKLDLAFDHVKPYTLFMFAFRFDVAVIAVTI